MTTNNPSKTALSLLDNIADLSDGFRNSRQGAREGLLGACARLVTEISLPSENMIQLLWAQPAHLNILWMAVEVRLFHAMTDLPENGASIADITAKCKHEVDPIMIGRMLRHLAAMGTVRETGPGIFAPTSTTKAFAERSYEDSILYIMENFQPIHQAMPSYFREVGYKTPESSTDGPFQFAKNCKGSHYFDYFQNNTSEPDMGRRFASMMEAWSKDRPRWFYEDYYPVADRLIRGAESNVPFLVDVGGGSGHDIEGLRQAFTGQIPGTLILQDRPEIVRLAKLGPRAEAMEHDFMTEQPIKGARAYYLHSIIQDWSDSVNTEILKAIIPAMKKGYSKILVNDFVVPDQGAHWAQS